MARQLLLSVQVSFSPVPERHGLASEPLTELEHVGRWGGRWGGCWGWGRWGGTTWESCQLVGREVPKDQTGV